jgi:predicted kinase
MASLYIMCGLAFSGKSTLAIKIAEHTGAMLIAFDKLWVDKEKEQPIPKGDKGWKFIRKVGLNKIAETLNEGTSVVYDDNNPRFKHREEVRDIARKLGVKETVIYLNTPMETIRARETTNKITGERHEVESENFQKTAQDFETPTPKENFLEFTLTTDLKEFLQKLD